MSAASFPRVLVVLVAIVVVCDSARILGLFPTDTQSHYMTYGKLMRELADRGHQVTVLSLFPEEKKIIKNLNDIGLNGSYELPMMTAEELLALGGIGNELDIIKICLMACDSVLSHENTQKVLQQEFDLFITEVFGTDCFLSIGHKLGVPTIGVITSVLLPWTNDMIANPDNPSYVPVYFNHYSQNMNFIERLQNTVTNIVMKFIYNVYSVKESQKIAEKVFGKLPSLETLAKNYSLILTNTHNSINQIRPLTHQVIEVGGLHIPKKLDILPEDLFEFLNKSENGVVYFSLGSIAQAESMPIPKLESIIRVLGSLKENVLWKIDASKIPDLPDNVKPIMWTPQLEVLCHPNVKLFIAHGGMLGIQEATYCGVPILGIPFFADQGHNLAIAQDKGMGRVLNYYDLNEESFSNILHELLNNESYSQQAQYISKLFKDRPLHPLDLAMYWIEYVLKYNGAQHLKSPSLNLYWYQYLLLDVIFSIIVCLLVIIVIMKYIINCLFKKLSNPPTSHDFTKKLK